MGLPSSTTTTRLISNQQTSATCRRSCSKIIWLSLLCVVAFNCIQIYLVETSGIKHDKSSSDRISRLSSSLVSRREAQEDVDHDELPRHEEEETDVYGGAGRGSFEEKEQSGEQEDQIIRPPPSRVEAQEIGDQDNLPVREEGRDGHGEAEPKHLIQQGSPDGRKQKEVEKVIKAAINPGSNSSSMEQNLTCQVWPRQHQTSPSGIVVTLVLSPDTDGYSHTIKTMICNSIPSQLTHLVGPQQWDMLLIIAGDHFHEALSFEHLSKCLNLTLVKDSPRKSWENLDGSNLTTTEYRWSDHTSVFLSQTHLRWPEYINNDMSILTKKIEPSMCDGPKSYIQGTRWYSNELLHLVILQQYDWFIKMDIDLYFVKTVEWDLLHDLQTRNSLFAHTAALPGTIGTVCADNIVNTMKEYTTNQSIGICDADNPLLSVDRDHWYTNLIIMRVDFWTQPRIRAFGQFLSEHPNGFFKYRWTDQIFWAQALGMLVNIEDSVTDYTDLRCSVARNCWMAVFRNDLYGPYSYRECDNNAYFIHHKGEGFKWHRTMSHTGKLWKSDTEVRPLYYKDECEDVILRKIKEVRERLLELEKEQDDVANLESVQKAGIA